VEKTRNILTISRRRLLKQLPTDENYDDKNYLAKDMLIE
jgi:hypothetical protein